MEARILRRLHRLMGGRAPEAAAHVGEHVLQLGLGSGSRPALGAAAEGHVLTLAVGVKAQGEDPAAAGGSLDHLSARGSRHTLS